MTTQKRNGRRQCPRLNYDADLTCHLRCCFHARGTSFVYLERMRQRLLYDRN